MKRRLALKQLFTACIAYLPFYLISKQPEKANISKFDILPSIAVELPLELIDKEVEHYLKSGDVFLGVMGTDPKITYNQVKLFFKKKDGTFKQITQPIRFDSNGHPIYNDTLVEIYTTDFFSLALYDSQGNRKFYIPNLLDYKINLISRYLSSQIRFDYCDKIPSLTILKNVSGVAGQRIDLLEINHGSRIGGGYWFWLNDSELLDDGATFLRISPLGGWQRDISKGYRLSWWGPSNKVDSSDRVQAAITKATSTSSKLLLDYDNPKITKTIYINESYGWTIEGISRLGTTLKQSTDGIPLLVLNHTLISRFTIKNLTIGHVNQQSSLLAVALGFEKEPDGRTGDGIFNFLISNIGIESSFRGLSNINDIAIWGCKISDINTFGNMKGSVIRFHPRVPIGQPNIQINNVYIDCTEHIEPAIDISQSDLTILQNVEFNNGTYKPGVNQLSLATILQCKLLSCKSEAATVEGNNSLWSFPNSNVDIDACSVNGLSVPENSSVTILKAGNGGTLRCQGFSAAGISSGKGILGKCAIFGCDKLFIMGFLKIFTPKIMKTFPSDIPTIIYDVNAIKQDRIAKKQGDGSFYQLKETDPNIQCFLDDFVSDTTISLPKLDNIIQNQEFIIMRIGLGLFNLNIIDPVSSRNVVIKANNKGYIRYIADGTIGWLPIEGGNDAFNKIVR